MLKKDARVDENFIFNRTVLIIWPQVTNFWNNVLNEAEKTRLVNNIAGHLKDAKEFLQKRAVSLYLSIVLLITTYQQRVKSLRKNLKPKPCLIDQAIAKQQKNISNF